MIAVTRILTVDDAVCASAVLAEVSAGHEEAAARLAVQCQIDDLTNQEMEALCGLFEVEF
ncbi:MAG TPA: hypothetical protein VKU77_31700 [Streptosporangiaceae bacterium]|nr:hypothetical protein [Streptosporangiaceae bacterium]